jgi:hypothetical protein
MCDNIGDELLLQIFEVADRHGAVKLKQIAFEAMYK